MSSPFERPCGLRHDVLLCLRIVAVCEVRADIVVQHARHLVGRVGFAGAGEHRLRLFERPAFLQIHPLLDLGRGLVRLIRRRRLQSARDRKVGAFGAYVRMLLVAGLFLHLIGGIGEKIQDIDAAIFPRRPAVQALQQCVSEDPMPLGLAGHPVTAVLPRFLVAFARTQDVSLRHLGRELAHQADSTRSMLSSHQLFEPSNPEVQRRGMAGIYDDDGLAEFRTDPLHGAGEVGNRNSFRRQVGQISRIWNVIEGAVDGYAMTHQRDYRGVVGRGGGEERLHLAEDRLLRHLFVNEYIGLDAVEDAPSFPLQGARKGHGVIVAELQIDRAVAIVAHSGREYPKRALGLGVAMRVARRQNGSAANRDDQKHRKYGGAANDFHADVTRGNRAPIDWRTWPPQLNRALAGKSISIPVADI